LREVLINWIVIKSNTAQVTIWKSSIQWNT